MKSHTTALTLLSATSLMVLASPAWAQTPPDAAASAPQESEAAEQDDAIVVTAQRRAEMLTEVPASIQVVTADRLAQANISNAIDITRLTPGVSLDPRGHLGQPTVRGVGTQVSLAGAAANVSMYIDGIYQVSQAGNLLSIDGIEQIQILKGPQGTLYGRNSTGGAILVTTKEPKFDVAGSLSVGVGNFGERRASGFFTGPITDTLAVALTASYQEDNGFTKDLITGRVVKDYNDSVLRAKILWRPSDAFELRVIADRLTSEPVYAQSLFNGNSSQKRNIPTAIIPQKRGDYAATVGPDADSTSRGITLTSVYHLPNLDISFYTGYRQIYGNYNYDTDNGPLPVSKTQWTQNEKQRSAELNFASTNDGPFQYVFGAAAIKESGRYDPYLTNGVLQTIGQTTATSLSAFVDLSYQITERFKLSAGVRYDDEKIRFQAQRFTAPAGITDDTRRDDAWTPRVIARYEFDDHTNIYASYNRGFKTGGYNTTAASLTLAPSYGPEKIDGYEVGIKSQPLTHLWLELAAYHYDYSGIQVSAYQPVGSTGGTGSGTFVYNAAAARINGLDFSAQWRASSALSMNLGIAYNHARYSDFPNAVTTVPITACGAGVTPPCGNTQVRRDVRGNALYRAPDWTISGGGSYNVLIPGGRLTITGNGYYSSGFFGDPGNRLKQPAYFVLDGSIAFSPNDGPFKISVFGRNLTNSTYRYLFIDSALGDAQRYAPPRTYGVAASYKF